MARYRAYQAHLAGHTIGETFRQAVAFLTLTGAAAGPELRLVATTALRILTIVGVDQLIPIYPDLEAALTAPT